MKKIVLVIGASLVISLGNSAFAQNGKPQITSSNVTASDIGSPAQLSSIKSPGSRFATLEKNHPAIAGWMRLHQMQLQNNPGEVRHYVRRTESK